MHKLLSLDLWPTLRRIAKKARRRSAAVGYVTDGSQIAFGRGDLLITDASNKSIAQGLTSASALAAAWKRGAAIFSIPGLHAKVLLLDHTAVIGSANLSASSAANLVEAALITDDVTTAAAVASLVEQMRLQAQLVDRPFLDRIARIRVSKRPSGPRRSNKLQFQPAAGRTWLVGVTELDESRYPDEEKTAEEGMKRARRLKHHQSSDVSWLRFTGSGRFRREGQLGDSVIQIWSTRRGKKPSYVYRMAPILRRQIEPTCTRFYVEEDADAEKTKLSGAGFRSLATRAGLRGRFGVTSQRPLSAEDATAIHALWRVARAKKKRPAR